VQLCSCNVNTRTQNMRAETHELSRMATGKYRFTDLSSVLFSPGEHAALSLSSAHEQFDLRAIHASCLSAISDAVGILQIDPMFMQQLQPLLFIVLFKDLSIYYHKIRENNTHTTYREPNEDQFCQEVKWQVRKVKVMTTDASPKSLSLICPCGSNKKF
jgi:hypothetical protein